MGKHLEKTDTEVAELLARAISSWHPDLGKAGVRIAAVYAHPATNASGQPSGPALTHRGFQASADIRPARDIERLLLEVDAVLRIASDIWSELDDRSKLALIDHELSHLVVQLDHEERPKTHDDGRPKVGTIEHDWLISGFSAVVQRHGKHAMEMLNAQRVRKECQLLFQFETPRPSRCGGAKLQLAGQ